MHHLQTLVDARSSKHFFVTIVCSFSFLSFFGFVASQFVYQDLEL